MNKTKSSFFLMTMSMFGAPMLASCAGTGTGAAEPEGTTEEIAAPLRDNVCPPGVPADLKPDTDQTLKTILTGIGVQVYICNATATGFAWTFVTPQANLLNDAGALVGTHFIGPTWQSNDGSSVVAAKAAGVTVDPSAIQWLLLDVVSHAGGGGRFADVTSIQRLSTVGGIAPSTICDASQLGKIAQVPYSAEYAFYKTKEYGKVRQCGGT